MDQPQHLSTVSTRLQLESLCFLVGFFFWFSLSRRVPWVCFGAEAEGTLSKPKRACLIQEGWLLTQTSMKIEPISSLFRARAPNH